MNASYRLRFVLVPAGPILFLFMLSAPAVFAVVKNISKMSGQSSGEFCRHQSRQISQYCSRSPMKKCRTIRFAPTVLTVARPGLRGTSTWARPAWTDRRLRSINFGNLFLVIIDNSLGKVNSVSQHMAMACHVRRSDHCGFGRNRPAFDCGRQRAASGWIGTWAAAWLQEALRSRVWDIRFRLARSIRSQAPSGSFGGIAVGPGTNGSGKVMVVYQNPTGGEGPATHLCERRSGWMGDAGFGSRVTVTTTNVGGFDFIPARKYGRRSMPSQGRLGRHRRPRLTIAFISCTSMKVPMRATTQHLCAYFG